MRVNEENSAEFCTISIITVDIIIDWFGVKNIFLEAIIIFLWMCKKCLCQEHNVTSDFPWTNAHGLAAGAVHSHCYLRLIKMHTYAAYSVVHAALVHGYCTLRITPVKWHAIESFLFFGNFFPDNNLPNIAPYKFPVQHFPPSSFDAISTYYVMVRWKIYFEMLFSCG